MDYNFDDINVKALNDDELIELAHNIRLFLVDNVSKTGGHLGSNLGVVELTIMLHKIFNSPTDKFIFDVGHQGYVHKILTGRSKYFPTLRQKDGLSGFLKRTESPHDVWEAGHSSTSISAACGMAKARDLKGSDEEVIAIIGDGSLVNGMCAEALNHLSTLNTKVIIILNDNEMSISNNIGFVDDLLKGIQLSNRYEHLKSGVKHTLYSVPGGEHLASGISKIKEQIKSKIHPSQSLFNLMGFDYIGPIDGHDFTDLEQALSYAKAADHSVIVHVKTIKGHGYKPAEDYKWHGVNPFDPKTGLPVNENTAISNSGLIARGLEQLMSVDEDIVVITPAMETGSELGCVHKHFPDRFTDVGIAEEHAVTFSAGLAMAGIKPFCCIYSTFLQRSYDQILHDVVRQEANVVIGIDRAGIVGNDGETHQGIYDLSFLQPMPGLVIIQGSNQQQMLDLLKWSFDYQGPVCIRYPRGGNNSLPIAFSSNAVTPFKWEVIKEHDSCYVITYGNQVEMLRDAPIDAGLINACFIKPLDLELLRIIKDKHLIVVEEHVQLGGLNTTINQAIHPLDMDVIALPNDFIRQGNPDEILAMYDLSKDTLIARINELVKS